MNLIQEIIHNTKHPFPQSDSRPAKAGRTATNAERFGSFCIWAIGAAKQMFNKGSSPGELRSTHGICVPAWITTRRFVRPGRPGSRFAKRGAEALMFIASTTPPNSWLQRAMAARQVLSDFHIPLTLRLIRHDKKQRQPYAHAPILPASGITRMEHHNRQS